MEIIKTSLVKGTRIKGVKRYIFESEEEMNSKKAEDIIENFLCDWIVLQIAMSTGVNQISDEIVSVTVGSRELDLYLNKYTPQILATIVNICAKNAVKLTLNYKTEDGWIAQSL